MGNKCYTLMANLKTRNLPVVVVLGATGTGKSKLAIELARKFNGEIISADSMQVYKGLDIITNKVTAEEQHEAVHHFINCVDPLSCYTVVDYRNKALPIINGLLQKNKLPIIVGGTNYYIESLLWDILIKPEEKAGDELLFEVEKRLPRVDGTAEGDPHFESNLQSSPIVKLSPSETNNDINEIYQFLLKNILNLKITKDSFPEVSSNILHQLLVQIDPAMASIIHPNNKRKIIRSLQVYQQWQSRHSEILSLQRSQKGGSLLGGPLRYKNSIMLWIQCEKSVLDNRLFERVDQMIKDGLVNELLEFHEAYNQQRLSQNQQTNYSEGIFQSIGFKEFHKYLVLSEEERATKAGLKIYDRAVYAVKERTRKYATKQKKWIKNRFLKNPDRDLPPVYGLNGSDLNRWNEDVFDVACDVVSSALQGRKPIPSPLPVEEKEIVEFIPSTHYCDICERVFLGQEIWEIHLASRTHERQRLSKKKKQSLERQCNLDDNKT